MYIYIYIVYTSLHIITVINQPNNKINVLNSQTLRMLKHMKQLTSGFDQAKQNGM